MKVIFTEEETAALKKNARAAYALITDATRKARLAAIFEASHGEPIEPVSDSAEGAGTDNDRSQGD